MKTDQQSFRIYKAVYTYGLSFEYMFERRRYGTGAGSKTFTWLNYRKPGTREWKQFGDPWPSVRISKKDLTEAFVKISEEMNGGAK